MALQVINIIVTSLKQGISIFYQFMQSTGLYPLYTVMAFILMAVIYLVKPFLVNAGSDLVQDVKSFRRRSRND